MIEGSKVSNVDDHDIFTNGKGGSNAVEVKPKSTLQQKKS